LRRAVGPGGPADFEFDAERNEGRLDSCLDVVSIKVMRGCVFGK